MRCPNLKELPSPPRGKTNWPWTTGSLRVSESVPDGRPWPKISIVTPSYNQGQFIEETIRSVLLQGYPNLEYIIIDGGSTDNTLEIIQAYDCWLNHWVSEKDRGQSHAINKGWKKASGDIVAWVNADDLYCPGTFETIARLFQSNSELVLVSGAANTVDEHGKTVLFTKESPDMDPYRMLQDSGGVPTQPSVFLKRRVLGDVGFLNPSLYLVMDWEFWIRVGLFYRPDQFEKTDKVLSNNRQWSGTKTLKGWRAVCQENRQVFNRVFSEFRGDKKLQRIRRRAYSASYRKQAYLAWQNRDTFEAIKSLTRSWTLAPSAHNPLGEFGFLLSVILGPNRSARLKRAICRREGQNTGCSSSELMMGNNAHEK